MYRMLAKQLSTRIKEHRRNGNSFMSHPTVITQHMTEQSHSFDWDTQILDTEPNYYKRSISEMLHIKEQVNDRYRIVRRILLRRS